MAAALISHQLGGSNKLPAPKRMNAPSMLPFQHNALKREPRPASGPRAMGRMPGALIPPPTVFMPRPCLHQPFVFLARPSSLLALHASAPVPSSPPHHRTAFLCAQLFPEPQRSSHNPRTFCLRSVWPRVLLSAPPPLVTIAPFIRPPAPFAGQPAPFNTLHQPTPLCMHVCVPPKNLTSVFAPTPACML